MCVCGGEKHTVRYSLYIIYTQTYSGRSGVCLRLTEALFVATRYILLYSTLSNLIETQAATGSARTRVATSAVLDAEKKKTGSYRQREDAWERAQFWMLSAFERNDVLSRIPFSDTSNPVAHEPQNTFYLLPNGSIGFFLFFFCWKSNAHTPQNTSTAPMVCLFFFFWWCVATTEYKYISKVMYYTYTCVSPPHTQPVIQAKKKQNSGSRCLCRKAISPTESQLQEFCFFF